MIADTRGLDGSAGHALAYSTSRVPGWTIVIDEPRSTLFANARRGFLLELALIAAAASLVLFLIAYMVLRGRREAERERTRERQRRNLTRILGDASLGSEVSDGLVAGLSDAFPGALCIVALEGADHQHLELAASAEGSFPVSSAARELVVAQAATLAHDEGSAIVIGEDSTLRATLPGVHRALRGAAHSFYATPLVTRNGGRLGALCLLFAHAHPLDESEQAQVAWYAEQAAQAIDRTTAFQREHEVAVRLQRSLLSDRLPEVEGVELIGRYNAGGVGLEIGGDWYDAVRRSDGIVHVTVGDVAGHGVTAAVLMGQLRNAFRAHAYEHTSPAAVLRRMLRHVDDDEMATALCLTLDPYTQELTYASAGHPPSLLVDGDAAEVSRLELALAPPLGYVAALGDLRGDGRATGGSDARGVHRRPGRAARLEHRHRHRPAGVRAQLLRVAGRANRSQTGSSSRSLRSIGSADDIALLIVRMLEVPRRHGHRGPRRRLGHVRPAQAPAHLARAARARRRRARRRDPRHQRGLQQRDRARATTSSRASSTCSWSTARARSPCASRIAAAGTRRRRASSAAAASR